VVTSKYHGPRLPLDPQELARSTTTNAAAADTILALDLGKYKTVAGLYPRGTAQTSFDSITTSRAELLRLLDRHRPGLVVLEACALAGWVHDLCQGRGLARVRAHGLAPRSSYSFTASSLRPAAACNCVLVNPAVIRWDRSRRAKGVSGRAARHSRQSTSPTDRGSGGW
jgi:hypothetical protein